MNDLKPARRLKKPRKQVNGYLSSNLQQAIKKYSKKRVSVKQNDFSDLAGLVRSLQRAEGNQGCFRTEADDCDRLDCLWRSLCLEQPEEVQKP